MNVCKNEGYAESFVQNGQVYCDNVYEKMQDLTEEQEVELSERVYEAMAYKAGHVNLTIWSECCKMDFRKREPAYVPVFIKRVQITACTLMGVQLLVSLINSILEVIFYHNLSPDTDLHYITSHCRK